LCHPSGYWAECDSEQVTELAKEVDDASLGTAQDADLDVTLAPKSLDEEAQDRRLARSWRTGNERKSALARELLHPPAEGLRARRDMESLDGDVGGKWVPLEAIKREVLVVGHDASPSSSGRSSLGR
jgi:hypothetical protein